MSEENVKKVTSEYKKAGIFSELFFFWLNPLVNVFFIMLLLKGSKEIRYKY